MEIFDDKTSADGSHEREMLATFLQELADNLTSLEATLIELERGPKAKDQINAAFRLFHNTKGSSAMMSLPVMQDIAHWCESLLDLVRSDRMALEPAHVDLLLEALAAMREIHRQLKGTGDEGKQRYFHLLARLSDETNRHQDAERSATEAGDAGSPAVEKESVKASEDDIMKVSRGLIDQMMLLVGDFMQVKNRFEWLAARYPRDAEFADNCRELEVFSSKLQRSVLKLRLSSVSTLFSSMNRVVRATSAEVKKKVTFEMTGADTLLDRAIIDVLGEPLIHMIRNAIGHGLESEAERVAANKPPEGHVALSAVYRSGEIYITVSDDGKGIDPERIRAKAVEKGFITPAQAQSLTPQETLNLIFIPGFSSADSVTKVSGRGVGMDVVKAAVESVGGQVEVRTELGVGTAFNLRLPLSLAIVECLGFVVGRQTYALPQANVEEVYSAFSTTVDQHLTTLADGKQVLVVRNVPIAVLPLAEVFASGPAAAQAYILVRHGKSRFILAVDRVTGPLSIVSQPLPASMASAPFSGVTKQGDGSLLFQVDVGKLATHVHHVPVVAAKRSTYVTSEGRTDNAAMMTSSDIRRLQQKIITFRNLQNFCIPVQRAKRIVSVKQEKICRMGDDGLSFVTIDGQTIPLLYVEEIMLKTARVTQPDHDIVIVNIRDKPYGIPMAQFRGIQRMPENYDRSLVDIGISGSTVIDGETYVVLDLHGLLSLSRKSGPVVNDKRPQSYKVLVAEDDGFFAAELVSSLRGADMEVALCQDGLEAKHMLEDLEVARTIDLVITDIEMPNLNGIGLIRWIKSCAHTRHLPCIVHTAISSAEMRIKAAQVGAVSLVSKMKNEQLLAEIAKVRRGEVSAAGMAALSRGGESSGLRRVVTFALGGAWFALPMDSIKEVSPPSGAAIVPDAPPWMSAVTYFRGGVVPVIDLAALLGFAAAPGGRREQAVVEVQKKAFALIIGQIGEVVMAADLVQGEGISSLGEGGARLASFAKTTFKCGSRVLTLLDVEALGELAQTGKIGAIRKETTAA